MSDRDSDGFLHRWSRLKRDGDQLKSLPAAPAAPSELVVVPSTDEQPELPVPAADAAAPLPLTDADMPPIESLTEESDFGQFLSQGVSDALRRQALRKLFTLPEFHVLDGLNDYDDDFTQFEPLGDTVTYQMKQWLQRQAEAAEAADEAIASEQSLPPDAATVTDPVASADVADVNDDGDEEGLGEADG